METRTVGGNANVPSDSGTKTFWTGLGLIVAAVGGYFMGELDGVGVAAAIFAGLQSMFVRDAIAKGK